MTVQRKQKNHKKWWC